MNIIKNIKYVFTGLLASLLMFSCNFPAEDEFFIPFEAGEVENPETLSQFVIAREDLTIFESALRILEVESDFKLLSDLNVPGNSTIFAPTDAAFQAWFDANNLDGISDLPVDLIEMVVLNHIVEGEFKAADLTSGYLSTMSQIGPNNNRKNISMYVDVMNAVVTLNGEATVTMPDVDAINGVLHIVDSVIDLPTVADFAAANPLFSSLIQAVQHADTGRIIADDAEEGDEGVSPGIENVLRVPEAELTLFAPTNTAFSDLLLELDPTGATALIDINPLGVAAILFRHLISNDIVTSDELQSGDLVIRNTILTVDAMNFTITDPNGRVSNIITDLVDIVAVNGVIHAIDKVILPALSEEE